MILAVKLADSDPAMMIPIHHKRAPMLFIFWPSFWVYSTYTTCSKRIEPAMSHLFYSMSMYYRI